MMLSVIIPTYNRLDLVKFTLDSLDQSRHKGVVFEIIVIDDGSVDGTKEFIIRNYPTVKLLANSGKGAASARNTGLAVAQGKYIMYLDSDDLAGEDYFEKKIELLDQQQDLNACYGGYEYFESNGAFKPEDIIFKHKYPMITVDKNNKEHLINYLSGNFLPQNAIIWKKDFLIKCKGHDASLTVNQDVDLFVRAVFKGLKITAVQDGTKVYVRSHSLDTRVGDPKNSKNKLLQILELRKNIFKELKAYGYGNDESYRALSNYLFGYWKLLRHTEPEMAMKYLNFAKEVFWPVKIKGNVLYKMLSVLFGPVNAVNMKYFLLKRD